MTVDPPQAGDGQVGIDVAYCGFNFADVLGVRGEPGYAPSWPFRPGLEIAGTVREAGPGVEGLSVGQPVAALIPGAGGYGEVAVAPAALTVPLPADLDPSVAAAVPLTVPTAVLLLKTAGFEPGRTVLVHSASGALAGIIAALAAGAGARLIGVVGRPESVAKAAAAGYDHVVVRHENWADEVLAHTEGAGVDVAFEPIGGASVDATLRTLRFGGRLISCGNAAGEADVSVGVAGLRRSSASIGGFSILGYARNRPDVVAAEIANALDLVATGKLKITPTVQRLTDAPGAHTTALAHASSGKVVFEI